MGHPGLEPEVVLTIQPAVPYPSPKGEVFLPDAKVPKHERSLQSTPIVPTPTHAAVNLAVIVILVQWEIPQTADG